MIMPFSIISGFALTIHYEPMVMNALQSQAKARQIRRDGRCHVVEIEVVAGRVRRVGPVQH